MGQEMNKQPADKVQVTYYEVNNFNVEVELPSRNR